MSTDNKNEISEEKIGIDASSMEPEHDEGENIDAKKSVDVTVDKRANWKQNTGANYKSTSSAIDEFLSNAVTSTIRASQILDVWDAEVRAKIIQREEGELYLIIEDGGLGMSESLIDNVLSSIGTTTHGATEEAVNSKWGKGWYAGFMLCGGGKNDGSGAFLFSTNPRVDEDYEEDKPPHNVLCVPGEMKYVRQSEFSLEPDEYGTRVKFPVRDGVTADQIEEWIREYGKYSRVPIMFERRYPDGTVENDELVGRKLEDNYNESEPAVCIEEEGVYRAVASPSANGDVAILDQKTEHSHSLKLPLYSWWNVDIRLLSEKGPIYMSEEDEEKVGKVPMDKSKIQELHKNKRNNYIPKEDVNRNKDYTQAKPSGTRDIIELSEKFREHIFEQLEEKILSKVGQAVDNMSKPSDWNSLTDEQSTLLSSIIDKSPHRWNIDDQEAERNLRILSKSVGLVQRDSEIYDRYDATTSYKRVYQIIGRYDEVYFGKSILQRRAEAVWEHSDTTAVVQLNSTDNYDLFEEIGWEKITQIRSTTVTELDVSDETISKFKKARSHSTSSSEYSSVAEKYDERTIKIHYDSYSKTRDIQIGEIHEFLDRNDRRLVVFTSTSEYKISRHREIVDNYTATAKCVNKVYEEKLSQLDSVIPFEEYENHNKEYKLFTNRGYKTITSLTDEETTLNKLSQGWKETIIKHHNQTEFNFLSRLFDSTDTIVLLDDKDISILKPFFSELSSKGTVGKSTNPRHSYESPSYDGSSLDFKYISRFHEDVVEARLPKWSEEENPELKIVGSRRFKKADTNLKFKIIDKLAAEHDRERKVSNITSESTEDKQDIVINTSHGKMSLTEISNHESQFVIYPISDEVSHIIGDIPIDVIESYIEEDKKVEYNLSNHLSDDTIFATEKYDVAQPICRQLEQVTVIKPREAPEVGNASKTLRLKSSYSTLYAYHLFKNQEDIKYHNIRDVIKRCELNEEGERILSVLSAN